MIRNRLRELLAERGLKNARVARDIKSISRNTINTTANNKGKMIQLETINALCRYLGVSTDEFFEYLPFDIEVSINSDGDFYCDDALKNQIDHGYFPENGDGFIMPSFFLNLYLEKKSGSLLTGEQKRVFELSAVLVFDTEFVPTVNNVFAPDSELLFRIQVGNPPNEVNEDEQRAFLKFWNEDLTPGFQIEIKEQIEEKINKYLDEVVFSSPYLEWGKERVAVVYSLTNKKPDVKERKNAPQIISKSELPAYDESELPF